MDETDVQYVSDYIPSTRRAYHYRAIKVIERSGRSWVCEQCGSLLNLQVHHRDSDYRNNDCDNLAVVCAGCHSKIHDDRIIPKRGRNIIKKVQK